MDILDLHQKALSIATTAHSGQKRWSGEDYINHPLNVALSLQDIDQKIVAILHDAVEDSDITIEDLRKEGFYDYILDAIDSITKRENEDYEDYIMRVRNNKLAREVKISDLNDNMKDLNITSARYLKYKCAKEQLEERDYIC